MEINNFDWQIRQSFTAKLQGLGFLVYVFGKPSVRVFALPGSLWHDLLTFSLFFFYLFPRLSENCVRFLPYSTYVLLTLSLASAALFYCFPTGFLLLSSLFKKSFFIHLYMASRGKENFWIGKINGRGIFTISMKD